MRVRKELRILRVGKDTTEIPETGPPHAAQGAVGDLALGVGAVEGTDAGIRSTASQPLRPTLPPWDQGAIPTPSIRLHARSCFAVMAGQASPPGRGRIRDAYGAGRKAGS